MTDSPNALVLPTHSACALARALIAHVESVQAMLHNGPMVPLLITYKDLCERAGAYAPIGTGKALDMLITALQQASLPQGLTLFVVNSQTGRLPDRVFEWITEADVLPMRYAALQQDWSDVGVIIASARAA